MSSTAPMRPHKNSSRPPHTSTPLERVRNLKEWIDEHIDDAIDDTRNRADDLAWALDHEDELERAIGFHPFIQSFSNTFCACKMKVASCELVDGLPEGKHLAGKTPPEWDDEGNIIIRIRLCRSPTNWQKIGTSQREAIVNCLMHELVHADLAYVCCWGGCGREVAFCRDKFWQQGGSTGHGNGWHLLAKMIEEKAKSSFSFEVNLGRRDSHCAHWDPKWSEISEEDARESFEDYTFKVKADKKDIWLEVSHSDGWKGESERFRKSRRSDRARRSRAQQKEVAASKNRSVVGAQ